MSASFSEGLTAVCLSGQLRSFLEPHVQMGLVTHFHHPGYEYIISINERISQADTRLLIKPVVAVYVDSGSPVQTDPWVVPGGNHHGERTCPRGTSSHFYLFPQFIRLAACHQLLQTEEARRRMLYAYVVRTRTDLWFVGPVPPPAAALAQRGGPPTDVLLFDDQLAMAPRAHASTILINPLLVYRECHGAEHWSMACAKQVSSSDVARGAIPCPPMNLIVVYGHEPTRLRQCGFLWACKCKDLVEGVVARRRGDLACLAVLASNDSRKHHTRC